MCPGDYALARWKKSDSEDLLSTGSELTQIPEASKCHSGHLVRVGAQEIK